MPAGAVIAARQALGQYLVYAPPWQRRLIGVGVVAGGVALLVAGVVTGHVVMAVVGGALLVSVVGGVVRAVRVRVAWRRDGAGSSVDRQDDLD
jgi:hypothetical protein